MSLTNDELIQEVRQIGMEHMDLDIDIRDALLDGEPGAEKRLAIYLVQGYYNRYKEKLGTDTKKQDYLNHALTLSKFNMIQVLTKDLHGLIDRATIFAMNDATETGWFHDLEFSSLTDMLAAIYDGTEEDTSAYYDWKFISEHMVPIAQKLGVDIDKLTGASLQTKKIRGAVPTARMILEKLKTETIDETRAAEEFDWMFGEIANPNVSYIEMKDKLDNFRGISAKIKTPLRGEIFVVPNGTWMLVKTNEVKEVAMIQQALKNRVDFSITDIAILFEEINKMLKIGKVITEDNHDTSEARKWDGSSAVVGFQRHPVESL